MHRNSAIKQRGSLLILALFVLIVIGILGLSLSSQLRTQNQNVVFEVQGVRAGLAASTGLEQLGLQSFPIGGVPVACIQGAVITDLSLVPGLQNCEVSVRCNTINASVGGTAVKTLYQFESTGLCQGGSEVASRTLAQEAIIDIN